MSCMAVVVWGSLVKSLGRCIRLEACVVLSVCQRVCDLVWCADLNHASFVVFAAAFFTPSRAFCVTVACA